MASTWAQYPSSIPPAQWRKTPFGHDSGLWSPSPHLSRVAAALEVRFYTSLIFYFSHSSHVSPYATLPFSPYITEYFCCLSARRSSRVSRGAVSTSVAVRDEMQFTSRVGQSLTHCLFSRRSHARSFPIYHRPNNASFFVVLSDATCAVLPDISSTR